MPKGYYCLNFYHYRYVSSVWNFIERKLYAMLCFVSGFFRSIICPWNLCKLLFSVLMSVGFQFLNMHKDWARWTLGTFEFWESVKNSFHPLFCKNQNAGILTWISCHDTITILEWQFWMCNPVRALMLHVWLGNILCTCVM
jgi:hypothetical protein